MPTIFRFLVTVAVLAGLVFAGMIYLGNFVAPSPREMTIRIPSNRLAPTPIAKAPATPELPTDPAATADIEAGEEAAEQPASP